ncbi:putative transcription factor Ovo-like 1 [Dissostichus eleginoides]|uniref:Transcription factor Ovo-like 1 n=1 Tax=Dissostichus eleginoides TaxID=100907 RepID=A0AAD9F8I1_DISEL|nr:putative transcription factor Ovo-like 1 [Dissostichus eleginoides]
MPRAFLVKKANVSPGKRSWSELPDYDRGDVYIPVHRFPPSFLVELPSSTALGRHSGQCTDIRRRAQGSPYIRSKIKVTTGGLHGDQVDKSELPDGAVHVPGVRPYKCTLCEKAFTQRCSLESHMKKIHSVAQKYAYKERRNKLYVCEECGLTSGSQDELVIHLNSLHPDSALLKGKAARMAGGGGEEESSPGSPHGAESDDTTGSAGQ